MVYLSVVALTVKTVGVPLAGFAVRKAVRVVVPIAADLVGEWVGSEIRQKIESGEAKSRLEALGQSVGELRRRFASRPGRGVVVEG